MGKYKRLYVTSHRFLCTSESDCNSAVWSHSSLYTNRTSETWYPDGKTGSFFPVTTFLEVPPHGNISNRYRLLDSVRRLKTGYLGLFE